MFSLPKLLLEAAGRKATEVVIESGRRAQAQTPSGREEFGDTIGESDLFEALSGVLAPEQQAELAVGNMVEFKVSSPTGEWKLVIEPSLDGIVLRGRRAGEPLRVGGPAAGEEVGMPMDLPPLAPFEPEQEGAPAPDPVFKRRTQFDLGLTSYAEDNPPWGGELQAPPPVPPPSGGRSPLPPPPPVADLTPGGESGVDFAIVPDGDGPSELDDDDDDRPRSADIVAPKPRPAVQPNPPTPPMGVERRSGSSTRNDLVPLLNSWRPGSLCFASDSGLGEQLARSCGEPVTILDEPSAVDLAGRMLSELALGATYLVRLEDPSRVAAWVLRRLEEGSRAMVETRARDVAAAKRIFIGLGGEAAARWLAAHPVLWLGEDDDRWWIEADGESATGSPRGNGSARSRVTPPGA